MTRTGFFVGGFIQVRGCGDIGIKGSSRYNARFPNVCSRHHKGLQYVKPACVDLLNRSIFLAKESFRGYAKSHFP